MSKNGVIRLVQSMSGAEKRHFRLSCKKQAGERDYLQLFDLIDREKLTDAALLEKRFLQLYPGVSLENTAQYLFRIITDNLVQIKINHNHFFRQFHHMLQARLLFERALPEEAYKLLKKVQHSAMDRENHLIAYLSHRFELDYLAETNFADMQEKQLVALQMKAKHVLRDMHHIHEHHSLYELLKYRLIYSGKALSEEDRKQLNDLLLSEVSLVTGRVKNSFTARKLHLLFQSFFFTDTGDYKPALKMFRQLTQLFEDNRERWDHPPMDYLSSLEGILDSLRTIRFYDEMDFYLQKIEGLTTLPYPEHFSTIADKTVMIYRLAFLTGTGNFEDAALYCKAIPPVLLKMYHTGDYEKQSELLFYAGLAYFGIRDFKKASKYINEIVLTGKVHYPAVIYRVARLLGLLIHYELGDQEYLDYEIRSYKRSFRAKGKLLKTESLLFKIIQLSPLNHPHFRNQQLWKKTAPLLAPIESDKYEMQLLKYYDFTSWIKAKFSRYQEK
ncbi:hypothetical protein [Compostibacter hankyongensis]|uniref:Tetratricopeptide repeat protein n=1 Tax=Compostibacter hankyongensis TaxID=1007089 RepID=A0ABP8FT02_9BACT